MTLFRSALYLPASNDRAMSKAAGLTCDVILFDLEDAVAPADKVRARSALSSALDAQIDALKIARINSLDTPWGADDLAAVAGGAEAILLPKVDTTAQLAPLEPCGKPIWAMIETPLGVLNVAEIAAHPQVEGLVLGANDLAKELRCAPSALGYAAQAIVLAGRAFGCAIFDAVHNEFGDLDGLREGCRRARDLGFDGKSLIHPAQIPVANEVFAPSEAELDLARRQIAAFEAIPGGVAVVNGAIVESLHVDRAKMLLQQADLINDRNAVRDA